MSIISEAPYYDKYDRSKKYTQLLAVPGRVAQARELTEIQSTMKDIIRTLGDSIMSDGDILDKSCQVIADAATKTVTITPGRIYFKGIVHSIDQTTIDISAEGGEIIGVALKESVVYAKDDSDLLDPALGFENFNQPGCDRLRSELEIVCIKEEDLENDDSIAILAKLVDGVVTVEQQAPNYSALNTTLARRTYDESGSYLVEGLDVRAVANKNDESMYDIIVDKGKAYVYGFEFETNSARVFTLPRALETKRMTPPAATYSKGARYLLTNGPYVKEVISVVGVLRKVDDITINDRNGALLSRGKVKKIESVVKNGYDYNQYVDYDLESGDYSYIRWLTDSYPGDNVIVTFTYEYEFSKNEYELIYDSATDSQYVVWRGTTNPETDPETTPVDGSDFEIIYDKYLARKDTVYMNEKGEIVALQGKPEEYGMEIAPSVPTYSLPLATIMSPPGGYFDNNRDSVNISVTNNNLTRFTMSDIHKLANRIRTLEYDQTVLSLNTEAKDYATDDKRGIFTDPFIDLSKLGLSFNLDALGKPIRSDIPIFSTAIDLESNMIHLTLQSYYLDGFYRSDLSTSTRYDRVVTLKKKGEKVLLSQDKATKTFLVAPYVSMPQIPEVSITPSLDTWYDDTYIEVLESINTSKVVSSSNKNIHLTTYDPSWHGADVYRTSTMTNTTLSATGTTVQKLVEEDVISEKAVTYMRPREITVHGSHFPPNLDNIECYFEGDIYTPMIPKDSTVAGTNKGSVRSDGDGEFKATFVIPEHIRTGTRLVTFKSNIEIVGEMTSAFTYYQATGVSRTIRRTLTTITTVLQQRVTTTLNIKTFYDPLAQTFVLSNTSLLSGVDIYFASVPTKNVPVTCEIREVDDGNIKSTVYGFETVDANSIRAHVSPDGSKAFRFNFNDPILCEANKEYAVVLRSTSTDYRVWVAEIGEPDQFSGKVVVSNPYLQGVLMSSSNNSSWTIHQKTDLKFNLIADTYENTSEVLFGNIHSDPGFCRIKQAAESILFEGTKIDWYYSLDNGVTFRDLSPYSPIVLSNLQHDYLLKAKLSKENDVDLTPILALDSVSVSIEKYDSSEDGYYVSKLISGLDEFTHIDVILDTQEPNGTNIEVYISTSNNNDPNYLLKHLTLSERKELNYGWMQNTYTTSVMSSTQCRLFIKLHSNHDHTTPAFRRLRAIMS